MLQKLNIHRFRNSAGTCVDLTLSFQLFGQEPQLAPVILINHALTGNAQVCGIGGWWNGIVGEDCVIDTRKFCVLCINIPGNGAIGEEEAAFARYKEFSLKDIARLQLEVLNYLNISSLYAIIGASIGGALAWQLVALKPHLAQHLVPIASHFETTDWLLANCKVQDRILNHSIKPLEDARMHAMTFYRTPQSYKQKFNNGRDSLSNTFMVENWLEYHGDKLSSRFQLSSYKFLNHLLTTINIAETNMDALEVAASIESHIHIITIDTDLFFLAEESWNTYVELSLRKPLVGIQEIKSIHGHDAFLIETEQVARFLEPIFKQKHTTNEDNTSRTIWAGEGWK